MSIENGKEEKAQRTISVKLNIDNMTDTVIKHEQGSLLLVALPLSVSKFVGLGFLWSVLDNMTTFYKHAEAQMEAKKKGGIIKAGLSDALALGKTLMPGA
jgi:hypothetical protein